MHSCRAASALARFQFKLAQSLQSTDCRRTLSEQHSHNRSPNASRKRNHGHCGNGGENATGKIIYIHTNIQT